MNKVLAGVLSVGLALTGCSKSSEKGGGAGDDTFQIVVPAQATSVKQGEVQTLRVVLKRGAGFRQGVRLEMKAPAGVQVEPGSTTVQPGDKGDLQVKVTAAADAAIGEHKVMVKGTPDKGEPTETEFKITVNAK